MMVEFRDIDGDHAIYITVTRGFLLPWLPHRQWWQLLQVSMGAKTAIGSLAISEALQGWCFDLGHPHGGFGGKLLTETVHCMIRHGATAALVMICAELRRRKLHQIPWMLRSGELAMYAVGHSETTTSLQALFTMAPHAIGAVCRDRKFSLLHQAAFCKKPRHVEVLLGARCDPHAQSLTGETALHIACHGSSAENAEIIELFLAHDAALANVMDDSGLVPLERLRHALRRRRRVVKEEPSAEENDVIAHILELLGPDPQRLPRCLSCGLRVRHRRTHDGRTFCGMCGVVRQP